MLSSGKAETLSPVQPMSAPLTTVIPAKRGWGCWCLASCVLVPLVFGLVATVYALWITAASGVVRIPILSSMAYAKHDPLRVVAPEKGTGLELISPEMLKALEQGNTNPEALNAMFSEEQLAALTKQLGRLSNGAPSGHLNIDVSEGMLTGSLRQTASKTNATAESSSQKEKPTFDLTRAQITVSKNQGIEVYLPFAENVQGSALRAYLRPSIVDESLRLDLTDLWIGNLHIPASWVGLFSREALDKALESAAPSLKQSFILSTLDVGEGNVHLEGTFVSGAL